MNSPWHLLGIQNPWGFPQIFPRRQGQDAAALGSHAPAPRGAQEDASVGGMEPTAHGQGGTAAEDLRPAAAADGGARTFLGIEKRTVELVQLVLEVVECPWIHKPWLN